MGNQFVDMLRSRTSDFLIKSVTSLLGVLGLSTLALFFAPIPAKYALLVILGPLALWLVFFLVGFVSVAKRDPKPLAAPVPTKSQAPTSAPPVSESGPRLAAALQWLESTTELPRGDAANDRPWFLAIGSKNSGKTTLLTGAGLGIEYPTWAQIPEEARARSGYSLYVTKQAVVADTPGEFIASEGAGHNQLLSLLKHVRRLRRRQPFSGILLVIDATEFLKSPEEKLELLAIAYREVLRKVRSCLHRNLPVYLVVSKCDLVPNFADFVRGMSSQNAAPWGFLLSREEREHAKWLDHCDRELLELYRGLVTRRTSQLGFAPIADDAVYLFPEEFQGLRTKLRAFLDPLFRKRAKQETAILRGVFLTAELDGAKLPVPEGAGRSSATATWAKTPGFARVFTNPFRSSARALLSDVVFANPARGTQSTLREVWNTFNVATLVSGAVTFCLLGVMAFGVFPAYLDNRGVAKATHRLGQIPETATAERLAALANLRAALLNLGADPHIAAGRVHHWTLFVGEPTLKAGLQLYEESVRKLLIESPRGCAQLLESALTDNASPNTSYRRLKTYLMITAPGKPREGATDDDRKRDEGFLSASDSPLSSCWARAAGSLAQDVLDHLTFSVHRLVEHPENRLQHALDATAAERIRSARASLAGQDPIQDYYNELRGLTDSDVSPVTLTSVTSKDVFTSQKPVSIPGIFTRKGWEQQVRPAIERLTKEYGQDRAWVLGLPTDANAVSTTLRQRYFKDYATQWKASIESIRLANFNDWRSATAKDWASAAATFVLLSGTKPRDNPSDSAYFRLLKLVFDNTWGDPKDDLSSAPQELTTLKSEFRTLHELVLGGDGKPGIQPYLAAFHDVYAAMFVYPFSAQCPEKKEALPALGDSVLAAGKALGALRPRIDPSISNISVLLQQPLNYVGGVRSKDVNVCLASPPPPPPPPPPPIVTLAAQPVTILVGDAATLRWNTQNASSVTIEPGIGPVNPEGSRPVRPTENTTYKIVVVGPGGTRTETVAVNVIPPIDPNPILPKPVTVSGRVTEKSSGVVGAKAKPKGSLTIWLKSANTIVAEKMTEPDGSFKFPGLESARQPDQICVEDKDKCGTQGVLKNDSVYIIDNMSVFRRFKGKFSQQYTIQLRIER